MMVRRAGRSATAAVMLLFIAASLWSRQAAAWGSAGQRTVTIDPAYQAMVMPVVQQRITQAGIRLAHLINLALDPVYRFGQ